MKTIIACLLLPVLCSAQKNETLYYDWQWKPCTADLARFVSIVKKTDSGWYHADYYLSNNSPQMTGLYSDSAGKIRNGSFKYFYHNGRLSSAGKYSNGKKEGVWLHYHHNGMMSDSIVYIDNMATGISLGWHPNGFMADSVFYNNNGTAVKVEWFDNGNVAAAGRLFNGKKTGKWLFFHSNGNKAAEEIYDGNGNLSESIYYTEAGVKADAPVFEKRDPAFTGGNEKWRSYLEKKLMFPPNYKLVNTNIVTVVITALINEDGEVVDAFVEVPFKKPFDDEALRVIKKSPRWIPGVNHNRRVATYIRQPVSFTQQQE